MNPATSIQVSLYRRAAGALLAVSALALIILSLGILSDRIAMSALSLGATAGAGVSVLVFVLATVLPSVGLRYWLSVAGSVVLGGSIAVAAVHLGPSSLTAQALFVVAGIAAVVAGVFGWPLFALETLAALGLSVLVAVGILSDTKLDSVHVLQLAFILIPYAASMILWLRAKNQGAPQVSGKEATYNVLAAQLNQVASKSEIVINAIGDGVLALDGHGIVQLINPAAQTMLGWDKADTIGLDFHSVLQLQSLQAAAIDDAQNPVVMTLQSGSFNTRNDVQIQTKSSKTFQANVQVSPVGQIGSGAIIVFRDITSEKAEEREQAEFISTASHEMRTPVAAIEGYLGLALNPATAAIDDKARMYLTKAHESAQHLGTLFQDLLDVSKADDGRMRNDPQIIDVSSFTANIVESLSEKAKAKNLILYFKPGETPSIGERRMMPVFYADVDNDHLREAVSNLVENAIKYTKAGDVSVNVTGDDKTVQVTVSDTGIGIPPEDIPHLFQKFYRVDNSDTREIGGTGLGLYLTRRLVEIMGGKIWVTSEYQKGSQFILSLPRVSHEDATARLEQAETNGFGTPNP